MITVNIMITVIITQTHDNEHYDNDKANHIVVIITILNTHSNDATTATATTTTTTTTTTNTTTNNDNNNNNNTNKSYYQHCKHIISITYYIQVILSDTSRYSSHTILDASS